MANAAASSPTFGLAGQVLKTPSGLLPEKRISVVDLLRQSRSPGRQRSAIGKLVFFCKITAAAAIVRPASAWPDHTPPPDQAKPGPPGRRIFQTQFLTKLIDSFFIGRKFAAATVRAKRPIQRQI